MMMIRLIRVAARVMLLGLIFEPLLLADTVVRSVAELTTDVKRSLVVIKAAARNGGEEGLGTGFVIDESGLVVTARHVIGDGREIIVELPDGRTVRATEVHASSSGLDLAVIRIPDNSLPPLALGSADQITDGREVVAMGHPRGFRNSVVSGVISGRHDIDGVSMIQLAMPIEPGNSGGPIVDREGRVLGIVTMKSTASDNLGFALPVNLLHDLLGDPNPVPIERWLTIGALDPSIWKTLFGANWRQRAGRISVDGTGSSFGGRSLCLSLNPPPARTFEIQVSVRLKDERGAAGLAFHSDGGDRHYGFYPSAGKLRLTRFNGADLDSWTILHNEPSAFYRAGDWNLLKVRVEAGKLSCFVNGQKIFESDDDLIPRGSAGLATFRGTEAEFRMFAIAESLPANEADDTALKLLGSAAAELHKMPVLDNTVISGLLPHQHHTTRFFEREAARLESLAGRMRQAAADVHLHNVRRALLAAVNPSLQPDAVSAGISPDTSGTIPALRDPDRPDVLRAALLIARLDNEEVDVEAYIRRVDQMAREVLARQAPESLPAERLAALDQYLFQENGFRGSRFEYYTRSNSYLNEVIDDREGLPITLSVLYIAMAERLDLNVEGVGLPGQFVVRYVPADPAELPALIDPFEKGLRLSAADAEKRIREALPAGNGDPLPESTTAAFLAPQTAAQIAERMLINLLKLSETERKDADVLRYLEVLTELAPQDVSYRAKRLEMRARTGRLPQAIQDVDWFIENRPDGIVLENLLRVKDDLLQQQAESESDK